MELCLEEMCLLQYVKALQCGLSILQPKFYLSRVQAMNTFIR